jgi:hypothetical protein
MDLRTCPVAREREVHMANNSKGVGRMRVVLESQIEATTSCTVVIHLTVAAATAGLRYIGRGAQ